ncbi:MAG: agmatinase [Bacteroidetes bacterium]|nr:agmatinase [Bacteroidota bacterium]
MNFAGIPDEFSRLETSRIVVLPVPYDKTSTWIKGSDKGPEAIIEASANMELYDIETDSEVFRFGIYTSDPISHDSTPKKMVHSVYKLVNNYIKSGKFVVTLGGEHSVSIGSIIAHAESFSDFSVLQLDAHADIRHEYEGSIYNHACVMARVREICPYVQVGIRSMDVDEKPFMTGHHVFFAKDLYDRSEWMNDVIGQLSKNVYITLDLDVFDPSVLSSTGTPEPGGLEYYQMITLLRKVNESLNVVGFDVVELCPNPANKSSDFLAAKLVYKMLSYKFCL